MDETRTIIAPGQGPDRAGAIAKALSVAYVCPFWPPDSDANGIVMYLDAITRGLCARGHTTTLLTQGVGETSAHEGIYRLNEFHERRGYRSRVFDYLANRANAAGANDRQICRSIVAGVRRSIAERGVQLLEMEESFGWAASVRRRISIPVIVRLHGPWFLNGATECMPDDADSLRRIRKEGEAIGRADGVSASSRDVLERTRAFYRLPLERAEVIHPPAPEISSASRWQREHCDPHCILFVGRFDRHKGGDLVIEAFARVARQFPSSRLRIVGRDQGVLDDRGRTLKILDFIRERIPEADIRDRIQWLGKLPNSAVMELRRKALVSVVSSRYDNFPTTVTEAMAMGCPMVASRTGGITEQISDGVNGLLCEADDARDLADKIGQLLGNPAHAAQLGAQARHDCEAKLSPSAISAKMCNFYENVLADVHSTLKIS